MADTAWKLNIDGHEFREYDLTIDDVEAMEIATGLTWRQINPVRSASVAKAMTVTLLVRLAGMDEEAAKRLVGSMQSNDYIDAISWYDPDEDLPSQYENGIPPVADGTSTPT